MDKTQKVYLFLKNIPKGRVTTYGVIANIVKIRPRQVGRILHMNPDPEEYPCHRVVNCCGKLALSYAFGGAKEQGEKLQKEGVCIVNNRVDLRKFLWHP
jgi:alkylated DNA nucleotide flippase Atl1